MYTSISIPHVILTQIEFGLIDLPNNIDTHVGTEGVGEG